MTIHHLLSGYTFVIKFHRAQAPGHTKGTEEVVKRICRGDDLMAYQPLLEFDYLSWFQTVFIGGLGLEFSKLTLCKNSTIRTT